MGRVINSCIGPYVDILAKYYYNTTWGGFMRLTQYLSENAIVRNVATYADLPIMEPLPGLLAETSLMNGKDRQESLNTILECVKEQLISWAVDNKEIATQPQVTQMIEAVLINPRRVAADLLVFVRNQA